MFALTECRAVMRAITGDAGRFWTGKRPIDGEIILSRWQSKSWCIEKNALIEGLAKMDSLIRDPGLRTICERYHDNINAPALSSDLLYAYGKRLESLHNLLRRGIRKGETVDPEGKPGPIPLWFYEAVSILNDMRPHHRVLVRSTARGRLLIALGKAYQCAPESTESKASIGANF